MTEFNRSDAIDFAHTVRMMVDALEYEGFEEEWVMDFVVKLFTTKR